MRRIIILLSGICLFVMFACMRHAYSFNGELKQDRKIRNLIIIYLDTLRADHLGCYGYFRDTSPNIDKLLAREGILFEQAFSQSDFTLPSCASLFTSKYVHNHKLDSIHKKLASTEITLAKVLKGHGYKTAAFIYNNTQFNPIYGLDQGFDVYDFGEEEPNRKPSFEKTMPKALKWISDNKDKAFFVFLHANDIHEPYLSIYEDYFDPDYKGPLEKQLHSRRPDFRDSTGVTLTHREIKHIIAHYDGGIKYADSFIPQLVNKLRESGLMDKTVVILLSDHGEILADRGVRFLHGFSLHDEEVHVPLIILYPGIKGIRIKNQVQLIDIMPTAFDFLRIDTGLPDMEGESLVPLIEGRAGKDFNKYVYAECIQGESDRQEIVNYQMMARSSSWKLIASIWKINGDPSRLVSRRVKLHDGAIVLLPDKPKTSYELYNLNKDPKEQNNLINLEDKEAKEARIKLLDKLLARF